MLSSSTKVVDFKLLFIIVNCLLRTFFPSDFYFETSCSIGFLLLLFLHNNGGVNSYSQCVNELSQYIIWT